MPVSSMALVERIARVIAGRVHSVNADGEDASASDEVDAGLARLSRRCGLDPADPARARPGDGRGRRSRHLGSG